MRQINLLPVEIRESRERYLIKLSMVMTISVTVLVVVMGHILLNVMIRRLERVSGNITPAVTIQSKLEALKQEITAAGSEREKFLKENINFMAVLRSRVSYTDLLKALSHSTHQKVWLNKLVLEAENAVVEMSGSSINTESVSEFLYRLKRLPFFVSVELGAMEKDQAREVINFNVRCRLR